MKITAAKNPRWSDSDHTAIDLDVNFAHLSEEWITFTATEDDVEEHGKLLHSEAKLGAYGPIGRYVNNG